MVQNGIILINKEAGLSSSQVDYFLKKKFNFSKVGHLGTLDPFAEGLLIIGINKATKALCYIDDSYKEYEASLTLGESKDSFDILGKTLTRQEIVPFSEDDILNVFAKLKEQKEQIPPIYSALKYHGKSLYKYARQSISISLKPRPIHIKELTLISFSSNKITFRCLVSRGTYIRSLGVDIAKNLNNLGYLSTLKRTKIGKILVKDSKKLSEISNLDIQNSLSFTNLYPLLEVSDVLKLQIINGKKLALNLPKSDYLVYNKNELLAHISKKDDYFVVKRGLF